MARYPAIYAGQRVTGTLLQSMITDTYTKNTTQTRASTTTLADDPDLTATLEATATYHVVFYIHYAALDTSQLQTAWTVPAGASGNRSAMGAAYQLASGAATAAAADGGYARSGVHGYSTAVRYGTRNNASNQCLVIEESVLTTTAGGTLALQWAQALSSATATSLSAGSSLHIRRLS
ncbi:hypothetical protein ABZ650_20635 [Streptomyces griseoviridis]|uniref:hypothetical protein n=1 Tax=Streptomyces griseoviridis TaxID=45398 RepID=UPI0033C53FE9